MEFARKDTKVAKFVKHFPSYKGRRPIKVREAKSYRVSDYWDGGSRTYTYFVDANTGTMLLDSEVGFQVQTAANPFNLRLGSVELRPGVAVVEHSIFRGKDVGLRVILHPDDYAKFNEDKP